METTTYRNRITGRLVEAVQLTAGNGREVFEWAPGKQFYGPNSIPTDSLTIFTPEGRMQADVGDWVYNAGRDRFWVAKEDGFDDAYVLAGESTPAAGR